MPLNLRSLNNLGIALVAMVIGGGSARALEITFDTSLDTAGFFLPGTQARTVLDAAGGFFESFLADDLDAISPGGGNSWQAFYENPQTGATVFATDPSIAADSLVIFVGARELGGLLGTATPGSALYLGGDAAWQATLASRGEGLGDYGPWGGSLAVADDVVWDYDLSSGTVGQYNLYSNLLHEIGHILGVGTAQSWSDQVDSGTDLFLGALATAEFGASVPLATDEGHWVEGTTSAIYGKGGAQVEAALDPSLALGAFKPFTELDVAGLGDVGWEIDNKAIPEPGAVALLGIGCGVFALRRRLTRSNASAVSAA